MILKGVPKSLADLLMWINVWCFLCILFSSYEPVGGEYFDQYIYTSIYDTYDHLVYNVCNMYIYIYIRSCLSAVFLVVVVWYKPPILPMVVVVSRLLRFHSRSSSLNTRNAGTTADLQDCINLRRGQRCTAFHCNLGFEVQMFWNGYRV